MTDERIFAEVADKKFKRNDIAVTYEAMMRHQFTLRLPSGSYDWAKINAAIIERWSISGLVYIKERAWKLLDQNNKARHATN